MGFGRLQRNTFIKASRLRTLNHIHVCFNFCFSFDLIYIYRTKDMDWPRMPVTINKLYNIGRFQTVEVSTLIKINTHIKGKDNFEAFSSWIPESCQSLLKLMNA